jgi:hypothetical protein
MDKLILEETEHNTHNDFSLLDCNIAQYNGRQEMKKAIIAYLYDLSEQGEIFEGYDEVANWIEKDIKIEGTDE